MSREGIKDLKELKSMVESETQADMEIASELGQLKNKSAQMEQAFASIKNQVQQSSQNQSQQQAQPQGQQQLNQLIQQMNQFKTQSQQEQQQALTQLQQSIQQGVQALNQADQYIQSTQVLDQMNNFYRSGSTATSKCKSKPAKSANAAGSTKAAKFGYKSTTSNAIVCVSIVNNVMPWGF